MKITLAPFNKKVNKEIFWKLANIWHQSCFCEQTFLEWLADAIVYKEPCMHVRSKKLMLLKCATQIFVLQLMNLP